MSLIRYYFRSYPRQSAITLVCLVAAAFAEGLGLASVVPLLAIAMGRDQVTESRGGQEVAELLEAALAWFGLPFSVVTVALVISVLIWLKAGLILLSMRQVGNTVAWIATDLRLELLRQLLDARWSYYSRQPLGRLTNAIATEATRASNAYRQLALAAKFVALSSVGIIVAMWLSWQLALVTLVGWGVIGVALNRLIRLSRRAGLKQTTVINSLLSRLSDVLLNVKVLKGMHREHVIGPVLERDTTRLQKALRKQVLAQESLKALQEPLMLLLLLATLLLSESAGLIGFEEITVMLLALTRSLAGATRIQRRYQLAVTNASAVDSLLELMETAREAAESAHGGNAPRLERAIDMEGVRLAYEGEPVLEGLNLTVPAGEITALIGGSGGGKTTLTDLVMALALPDEGVVRVDGVSLEAIDVGAWRRMIGYVPQEIVLLHDSVRVNVTFGDVGIPDEEVERALRAAGVWEVVEGMPGGLDASVGERGSKLSGGERARIGLARALAGHPQLLILDEATAALDPETEAKVLETLRSLRGEVTVLAISHQPALREVADRVYRIEAGRAERLDPGRLAS
jgi:ATP-binding cassette subfamily C protein